MQTRRRSRGALQDISNTTASAENAGTQIDDHAITKPEITRRRGVSFLFLSPSEFMLIIFIIEAKQ